MQSASSWQIWILSCRSLQQFLSLSLQLLSFVFYVAKATILKVSSLQRAKNLQFFFLPLFLLISDHRTKPRSSRYLCAHSMDTHVVWLERHGAIYGDRNCTCRGHSRHMRCLQPKTTGLIEELKGCLLYVYWSQTRLKSVLVCLNIISSTNHHSVSIFHAWPQKKNIYQFM